MPQQPNKDTMIGRYARFVGYNDNDPNMQPLFAPGERIRLVGLYAPQVAGTSDVVGYKAVSDQFDGKDRVADAVFPGEYELSDDQTPFASEAEKPIKVEGQDTPKATKGKGKAKGSGKSKAKADKAGADPVESHQEPMPLDTAVALAEPAGSVEVPVAVELEVPNSEAIPEEAPASSEVSAEHAAPVPVVTPALADQVLGEEQVVLPFTPPIQVPIPAELTGEDEDFDPYVNLQLDPTAAVRQALDSGDMLASAKTLLNQVEESYFTLGGVLFEIRRQGAFKSKGYTGKHGFQHYVEDGLGFGVRKARYFIDMYVKFRSAGLDERRITEIGWTKAKEMLRLNNEQLVSQFDDLVDAASGMNARDFGEHVKSIARSTTSGEDGSAETMLRLRIGFTVVGTEAELLFAAIEHAKDRAGISVPARDMDGKQLATVIQYIAQEWASLAAGTVPPLESEVARIERVYGVNLAVTQEDEEAQQAGLSA